MIDDFVVQTFDYTETVMHGVYNYSTASSVFPDVFSVFTDAISSVVNVIKNMVVGWYGGFSFSIWYFILGALLVGLVVDFIFKRPTGENAFVSDIKYKNAKTKNKNAKTRSNSKK